jgi:hypothetical protein
LLNEKIPFDLADYFLKWAFSLAQYGHHAKQNKSEKSVVVYELLCGHRGFILLVFYR